MEGRAGLKVCWFSRNLFLLFSHSVSESLDPMDCGTGVGCHFLLQCMKVKSESEVAQSCPTVSDPMDCSLPGSSAHGICQARVLKWGAIAFSDYKVKQSVIMKIYGKLKL